MPGTQSVAITEHYRAALEELTKRTLAQVDQAWSKVDLNNLDRSYPTVSAEASLNIKQAQREAVRLAAGYLTAFESSELGERVSTPPVNTAPYVGQSHLGRGVDHSLRAPLIKAKLAIEAGQDNPLGTGRKAMLAQVDLNVKNAARSALQDLYVNDDRIVGWRRAVNGTSCPTCIAKAGEDLAPGNRLQVHPFCDCVAEPVIAGASEEVARPTGQEMFEKMSPAQQDRTFGEVIADLLRKGLLALVDLVFEDGGFIKPKPLRELHTTGGKSVAEIVKFDPHQERWPAGGPHGGEWREVGLGGAISGALNWLGEKVHASGLHRRGQSPPPIMALITTGNPDMQRYHSHALGRLLVPDMSDAANDTEHDGVPFAMDNGGYNGVDEPKYREMVEKVAGMDLHPAWVTAPDVLVHNPDKRKKGEPPATEDDRRAWSSALRRGGLPEGYDGPIVGDADATIKRWEQWHQYLDHLDMPGAFVAQDGQDRPENMKWLEDHIDEMEAIFIGGSDEFKLGPGAMKVAELAHKHDKLIHIGRVNTEQRIAYARDVLQADSFDGSNLAKQKGTNLPSAIDMAHDAGKPPLNIGQQWVSAALRARNTGTPWPRFPERSAPQWPHGFFPEAATAKAAPATTRGTLYFGPLSDAMYAVALSDWRDLHFEEGVRGLSIDFETPDQLDYLVSRLGLPQPQTTGRTAYWPGVLVSGDDMPLTEGEKKYDPRQPRDRRGRWSEVPGSGLGAQVGGYILESPLNEPGRRERAGERAARQRAGELADLARAARHVREDREELSDAELDKLVPPTAALHGTLKEDARAIEQGGLQPQFGSFVREAYESEYTGAGYESMAEATDPVTSLTARNDPARAVNAMTDHIARKLDKPFHEVTQDDLRREGALAVVDDRSLLDFLRSEDAGYVDVPGAVEEEDYYSTVPVPVDRVLTGDQMMAVLDKLGALRIVPGGKKFDPNQPRDPHTGEWIDTPGADIRMFATPVRSEREDAESYYGTPRWRQFEAEVRRQAEDLGVTVEDEHRTQGIWSDTPEPSATYVLRGGNADRLAARIGRKFNQDAVLNFSSGEGPDGRWVFGDAGAGHDAAAVRKAAEDHGLFGATRDGNDIVVIAGPNMGGEDEKALLAFGEQLGASSADRYPGTARLIEREEYDSLDPPEGKSQKGFRGPVSGQDHDDPGAEAPQEKAAAEALAEALTGFLLQRSDGDDFLVKYDPHQPRAPEGSPIGGRWVKLPGFGSLHSFIPWEMDPHVKPGPRFRPRRGPANENEAWREQPRQPALFIGDCHRLLSAMKPGDRFVGPEGVDVECKRGNHFRIDGPTGTHEETSVNAAATRLYREEREANALRFGNSIAGNPMGRMVGVNVESEDRVGDRIGGMLHGGWIKFPGGTKVHRKPGEKGEGDSFEVFATDGRSVTVPATDKNPAARAVVQFEGDAADKASAETPNMRPGYTEARNGLHHTATQIGYLQLPSNEIALRVDPRDGSFSTPVFTAPDGTLTRLGVIDNQLVREENGIVTAADPIPGVDAHAASQVGDVFALGQRAIDQIKAESRSGEDTTTPTLWPEHFDLAIEHGISGGGRANVGVSPGDIDHPEPYFYVGPWGNVEGPLWNADTFVGAVLPWSEIAQAEDPMKLIMDFYRSRLDELRKHPPKKSDGAVTGKRFDPNQPRDPHTGEWIDALAPHYVGPAPGVTPAHELEVSRGQYILARLSRSLRDAEHWRAVREGVANAKDSHEARKHAEHWIEEWADNLEQAGITGLQTHPRHAKVARMKAIVDAVLEAARNIGLRVAAIHQNLSLRLQQWASEQDPQDMTSTLDHLKEFILFTHDHSAELLPAVHALASAIGLASDSELEHKDFDPNQPRDRIGRWTETPGAGTLKDPIDVGDNVDRAAQLLSEGKAVELHQPDEVSSLLDKLGEIVKDAEAKGEKAPTYDLCKVVVKGTNLFCTKSKGIPRVKMPQLKGHPRKGSRADRLNRADKRGETDITAEFKDHLRKLGYEIKPDRRVRADHLRPSQVELNGAKVAGILHYVEGGGKIEGPPLLVSRDNYIVDGHHRWASEVARDLRDNEPGDIKMPVSRVNIDIATLLRLANEFAGEWGLPQVSVHGPTKSYLVSEFFLTPGQIELIKKFDPNQPRDPHTGRWIDEPGLSDIDLGEATHRWEFGWSGPINARLRGLPAKGRQPDRMPEEVDQTVAALDRGIEEQGVDVHGGHLYRGFDASLATQQVQDVVAGKADTFEDAGFHSTTGALAVAGNFARSRLHPEQPVVLKISVPEGTKGLPIIAPTEEGEMLLPRGGKFKVTRRYEGSTYPGGPTSPILEVDWIPSNA